MKVTQLTLHRNFMTDLDRLNRSFANANRQLSSTKKLNFLGDSPLGSADLVSITDQALRLDAYAFNMNNSAYQLKTAETALNVVFNTVTSIYVLGESAATDTIDVAGRKAKLLEIEALRQELLSRGNTQVDGMYIFAGTKVDTKPFMLAKVDPTTGEFVNKDGSGEAVADKNGKFLINTTTSEYYTIDDLDPDPNGHVIYLGNKDVNSFPIGDDVEVKAGVEGDKALMAIFRAVDGLIDALKKSIGDTNDKPAIDDALGIEDALTAFGNKPVNGVPDDTKGALKILNDARGVIGVNLALVDKMSLALGDRKLLLRERRADIEDANLIEVASQIGLLQTAINAAISSGGVILQQRTLFDIIG